MKIQYGDGRADMQEIDGDPVHVLPTQDLIVTVNEEGVIVDRTGEDGQVLATRSWLYGDLLKTEE